MNVDMDMALSVIAGIVAANIINRVVVNPLLERFTGLENVMSRQHEKSASLSSKTPHEKITSDHHSANDDTTLSASDSSDMSKPTAQLNGDTFTVFFEWVKSELEYGSIAINKESSSAHIVERHLTLMSPHIFQHFIKSDVGSDFFIQNMPKIKSNRQRIKLLKNDILGAQRHLCTDFGSDFVKVNNTNVGAKKNKVLMLDKALTEYLLNNLALEDSSHVITRKPIIDGKQDTIMSSQCETVSSYALECMPEKDTIQNAELATLPPALSIAATESIKQFVANENETFNIFAGWLKVQIENGRIAVNESVHSAHVVNHNLILIWPLELRRFADSIQGCHLLQLKEKDLSGKAQRKYIEGELFKAHKHTRSVTSDDILQISINGPDKRKTIHGVMFNPELSSYLLSGKVYGNSDYITLKSIIDN
ncbi:MAG: DNA-binding domain-containing protein [Saccharospirillaceae bacterium]|nr:DNA-binding domain-containing protein [Saccharospirillaceae bacterium]